MAKGFAILRTKRITNINKAFNHNLRVDKRYSRHADETKTDDNLILFDKFEFGRGGANFAKRIDEHIEEKKIFVKAGTNIKCLEFMLTASPEFFKKATDKQKLEWRKTQMEFLKEEFGSSLLHVVEHNDEKTKHIQAIILADKKKLHKYKNQKGEFFKEKHCISPGDFNPDFLRGLQDRYALKNKKFGLSRGLRNSKATHRKLKDFYKTVDVAMAKDYEDSVKKKLNTVLQEEQNMFGYIKTDKAIELIAPLLNNTLKSVKALKSTLNFNTVENIKELNEILDDKESIKELKNEYFESVKKYDEVKKENEALKEKLKKYEPPQELQQQPKLSVNTGLSVDKRHRIK